MNNTCQNHPENIEYKNGIHDVAHDLSKLRYDRLVDFLRCFQADLEHDAEMDFKKGRTQLSEALLSASRNIRNAKMGIQKAWKISEPFMTSQ